MGADSIPENPTGGDSHAEERQKRTHASKIARVVAAAMFVLALVVLILGWSTQNNADEPQVTTNSSVVTTSEPGKPTVTTDSKTSETKAPAPDNSPIGRVFSGPAAPVLFEILLAALGAFLVGAVVQRVWLGEFGLTIGPVSIPVLPPITEKAAAEAVDLITESPEFSELLGPGRRYPQPFPQFQSIADDRLALLSIRIELEERLRELAVAVKLDEDIELHRLPERLAHSSIIDEQAARGLKKLVDIGDRIAGGAKLTPAAAEKLAEAASDVLYALAELRRRALSNPD